MPVDPEENLPRLAALAYRAPGPLLRLGAPFGPLRSHNTADLAAITARRDSTIAMHRGACRARQLLLGSCENECSPGSPSTCWRWRCRSSNRRMISRDRSDNMTTVLRCPSVASSAFLSMYLTLCEGLP